MTTKEKLLNEIDKLEDEDLEVLFLVIEEMMQKKESRENNPHFLDQLQQIQIDGPVDFSENIELYLTGEKHINDDFH